MVLTTKKGPTSAEIVEALRAGDCSAVERFNSLYKPGFKFLIARYIGRANLEGNAIAALQVVRDKVINGSSDGGPSAVRRDLTAWLRERRQSGPVLQPEVSFEARQATASVLLGLDAEEKNILSRIYVRGESESDVCRALGIEDEKVKLVLASTRAAYAALRVKRGADSARSTKKQAAA